MDACDKCERVADLYNDDESGLTLCETCLPGNETVVLDTPEQINMWILLSRRAQVKLHLKGLTTKGLLKWLKVNIEGCENARTVKDCVVPLEYTIAMAGGPQDFSLINVHVMERVNDDDVFRDLGIFPDMASVEANAGLVALYFAHRLELVYTLDEPRDATNEIFIPA
jgi:hypothetical protein